MFIGVWIKCIFPDRLRSAEYPGPGISGTEETSMYLKLSFAARGLLESDLSAARLYPAAYSRRLGPYCRGNHDY